MLVYHTNIIEIVACLEIIFHVYLPLITEVMINQEHYYTQMINVTRSLLVNIKTKYLKLYGHVERMEEGRLPQEVMKWRPPGRRK
jgi:hypothetical protein